MGLFDFLFKHTPESGSAVDLTKFIIQNSILDDIKMIMSEEKNEFQKSLLVSFQISPEKTREFCYEFSILKLFLWDIAVAQVFGEEIQKLIGGHIFSEDSLSAVFQGNDISRVQSDLEDRFGAYFTALHSADVQSIGEALGGTFSGHLGDNDIRDRLTATMLTGGFLNNSIEYLRGVKGLI